MNLAQALGLHPAVRSPFVAPEGYVPVPTITRRHVLSDSDPMPQNYKKHTDTRHTIYAYLQDHPNSTAHEVAAGCAAGFDHLLARKQLALMWQAGKLARRSKNGQYAYTVVGDAPPPRKVPQPQNRGKLKHQIYALLLKRPHNRAELWALCDMDVRDGLDAMLGRMVGRVEVTRSRPIAEGAMGQGSFTYTLTAVGRVKAKGLD